MPFLWNKHGQSTNRSMVGAVNWWYALSMEGMLLIYNICCNWSEHYIRLFLAAERWSSLWTGWSCGPDCPTCDIHANSAPGNPGICSNVELPFDSQAAKPAECCLWEALHAIPLAADWNSGLRSEAGSLTVVLATLLHIYAPWGWEPKAPK